MRGRRCRAERGAFPARVREDCSMTRRLLFTAIGLGLTSPIALADDAVRPAVRITAVRVAEEPTARGQIPETSPRPFAGGPGVTETRGPQLPPPQIPGYGNIIYDNPLPAGGPGAG